MFFVNLGSDRAQVKRRGVFHNGLTRCALQSFPKKAKPLIIKIGFGGAQKTEAWWEPKKDIIGTLRSSRVGTLRNSIDNHEGFCIMIATEL